jgi:uncharacterized protein (TIGR03083 family)
VGADQQAWLLEFWSWFETGVCLLTDILEREPPDKPVWNWSGQDQTARFWRRRMAHETAIHCCDASSAFGEVMALPTWLADDGIDELVSVVLPGFLLPDRKSASTGGWLAINAVDTKERIVKIDSGRLSLGGGGEADASAHGTASDLLLWSYGRTTKGVTLEGQASVADAWLEACCFRKD